MKASQLKKVQVPLMCVIGETNIDLDELSTLGEGSIIQLKSLAGESIDVLVSGEKIAKGEVVVIDENFGIRVTEISKQKE